MAPPYGKGRGGRPWRRLRAYILERDNNLCQPCYRRKVLTPAKEVDHIVALCNGGTDSDDNLEATCLKCHHIKTRHDQLGTSPGCDASGEPTDPRHHWREG